MKHKNFRKMMIVIGATILVVTGCGPKAASVNEYGIEETAATVVETTVENETEVLIAVGKDSLPDTFNKDDLIYDKTTHTYYMSQQTMMNMAKENGEDITVVDIDGNNVTVSADGNVSSDTGNVVTVTAEIEKTNDFISSEDNKIIEPTSRYIIEENPTSKETETVSEQIKESETRKQEKEESSESTKATEQETTHKQEETTKPTEQETTHKQEETTKPTEQETTHKQEETTKPTEQETTHKQEETTRPTEPETTAHTHHWVDITKTVDHPAEYKTVHHDAEYKTVHHDAEYETIHHDAVYEWVDPVYENVWIVDSPAWDETVEVTERVKCLICQGCGARFESTDFMAGLDAFLAHGTEVHGNSGLYAYTAGMMKKVVGYETIHHDETGHYESVVTQEGYNKLVKDAYDEKVLAKAAYDEKVLVKAAYDEKVLVKAAWTETVVTGQKCSECGKTK